MQVCFQKMQIGLKLPPILGTMMRFWIALLPTCLFGGWAETTLSEMTLDEKIGQLFIAPACPLRGEDHWNDWMRLIEEFHVGGAILKQSDPASQIAFLNRLQTESKVPLLIAGDMEWGLAMRMSDTIAFPRQMTLGAVADLDLIYEMGKEIGREAREAGIHLCLAPVADVNCTPENPIIHMRSFGENPSRVAERVSAYAKGLADGGTIACAKHFPGHGDSAVDSHAGLPLLPFSRERLNAVELVPFKRSVNEGIGALMSGHLLVPCIDSALPASLSRKAWNIAREDLSFQGLLVSDALNMGALSDLFSIEEIAFHARHAGTDLLLYGAHLDTEVDFLLRDWIPRAFFALKKAYEEGTLPLRDLEESVLRILRAKEKFGNARPLAQTDLKPAHALALKKRLFQEAVTLIGEPPHLTAKAAYLSIGNGDAIGIHFESVFHAPLKLDDVRDLREDLEPYDQVVIGMHEVDLKAQNFGLSYPLLDLIESLSSRAIFCHFATPYALKLFSNQKTLLVGYENDPDAQEAVYRVLTGQEAPRGRLPVLCDFF